MKTAWMYLSQPNRGGAQLSTLSLADGLRGSGWAMGFTVSYPGPFIEECRKRGHELDLLPMPEWYRFRIALHGLMRLRWLWASCALALRLIVHLRRRRPDLIYFYAPAALLLRLPVVYHLRIGGDRPNLPFRLSLIVARLVRAAVVCNSRHMLEFARRCGWRGEAEVVYNGISFDPSFDREKGEARAALQLPPAALVIGCAGRISRGKNIESLLRMTAQLKKISGRPLLLLIAGGEDPYPAGGLTAELRALGDELGLAEDVRWLGHLEEMGPFYRALDLFVSLSEYESFGRTIVEAMGAGVPAIATRTGGVSEIITDNVDGVFAPVDDPAEAARLAWGILSDPARAAELARAGRESARARFSLDRHVGQMLACFERKVDS